jgi:GNAT superfamily N-acetyltransferase
VTVLYKLRDYKETIKFEKEHPRSLQWDGSYKLYMLEQNKKCQGIWLRNKEDGLIGEIIVSWTSDNVLYTESFTIMPKYRGQGLGHKLISLAIEWAVNSNFEFFIGEARDGASWHIFKSFGASEILRHKNWSETNEEYISYKINL